MNGRTADTGRGAGEPPGGVHITEREARLLRTIREAEDPAAVMDAVLEAISALLQQSPPPAAPAPAAPGTGDETTQ